MSEPAVNPLLKESNLLTAFERDVERSGLVGEKKNASIVLLCSVSARLPEPVNLTVGGASAAGKNYLIGRVALFIPPEHQHFSSGFSEKALMHAGEDEFEHKAIFIAEYEGASRADYSIRTLQSEKVIEWHFVDSTSKGIKKRKTLVKGPAAFIQATTRSLLHPENETRQLFVQVDESEEATRAILAQQAQAAATGGNGLPSEAIEQWHALLRGLEATPVLVPFAPSLVAGFPASRVRSRRDFSKLLALIETCAFLHQNQREKRDGCILASEQDYRLVKPLFEHCYQFGPDYHTTALLTAAQSVGPAFTVAALQSELGWGKTKTYDVLERCREVGTILDGNTRGEYRLAGRVKESALRLPEGVK